jgi:hypothetical protein
VVLFAQAGVGSGVSLRAEQHGTDKDQDLSQDM